MDPLEEDYKYKYKEKVKSPFPDTMVHVDCPSCTTPIKAENINLDKMLAKCEHCNVVFDFEAEIPAKRAKPEVYLPKGMEILKLRSELEIQYKWRKTKQDGFQSFFTIVWNAMILPFAFGAIMTGQLFILLFMSVHLVVGMGLLYKLLANIINTTFVTVDENHLAIEHRPLRKLFKPDSQIPVEDIKQVFVEKYASSHTNGRPNYAYSVSVLLKNKQKVRFIKGLKHPDQAQYIEQEVEFFLGIDDVPVRGEFKNN